VVKVSYDPKSHKTGIHIEGDPRYDPKLIRATSKQRRTAHREALLNGAPVPPLRTWCTTSSTTSPFPVRTTRTTGETAGGRRS
jgi:hypothetical protein